MNKNEKFAFIVFLRVIAACLITNTHFGPIYPSNSLAVGGLIGDLLFFAISGYCLADLHGKPFGSWYWKRIIRVLPSVWIISVVLLFVGDYHIGNLWHGVKIFLYPTKYHFVGSIMLLYIPFYFIMRWEKLRERIPLLLGILTAAWLLCYFFFYDKSLRLDIAQREITKFPYFFCMLSGAYMKLHGEKFVGKNSLWKWLAIPVSAAVYFGSKLVVDRYGLQNWQFVVIIFVVWVSLAITAAFAGAENALSKRKTLLKAADVIAPLTLDIYVVQVAIIKRVCHLAFPLNFAAAVVLIFAAAWCLNRIVKYIIMGIDGIFRKSCGKGMEKSA